MVETLIRQLRTGIDGELSDKSRVTDQLLDLRLAAADHPSFVAEVDRLLADLPGLTTVENTWWSAALDDLELAAATLPVPVVD